MATATTNLIPLCCFFLLLPLTIANPDGDSPATTHCQRTCSGGTGLKSMTVNYPFGSSSGCPIQLSCDENGKFVVGEFQVISITADAITIPIPAECGRPFRRIDQLFRSNFAPTSKNAILLNNCSRASSCRLPSTMVDTHFESICGPSNANMSCYSQDLNNSDSFLDLKKLKALKCLYFLSSISAEPSNGSAAVALDVQMIQLGWWLKGDCNCSKNADCIQVLAAPSEQKGYRCRCRDGFVGDGFFAGDGCRRGVICPMDLSYVLTIPWNNSSCRNDATLSSFPPPLNDSCCNTLLSLYGIAFAQHLNETNFFELPNLDTSASCLQSFQSKLDSLNLPTNITSYCFSPSQFVIPEHSCASIKRSNDLVRQLESTQELIELNSSCRSDLTDPFNCVSCRLSANFASDKLLHEMEEDSVSNSTAAECYYFTILYAAGIINLMGPASRGVLTCIFTLPMSTGGKSESRWKVKLGIALLSTLVFAVVLIVIRCCNLRSCSSQIDENSFDVENFTNGIVLRKYPYSELKRITNAFSIKLGEGGYGSVYKGSLKDGRPVAVKILNVSKESSGEDFFNEVASIGRTAHVNVVALLGFCYERKSRALVYEFMPNGSLDKFITTKENSKRSSTLECKVLYKITLGIARGLEYLHRGCNTRIVHFDIKPHNILLDQDFVPKISDFGLAKLWQGKESMVSMQGTRGTIGYIAPEVFCRNFGGVSHKSDVYSYGMLVLDMVCGRYNSGARVSHTSDAYFPDWIYKEYLQLGKEIALNEITTEEEEEITRKMIIVSLWCIQNRPSDRPSIKEVIEMLEGSIQSLKVPLLKPFQASPERLPEFNSPSSSQSASSCS